MNDKNLSPRSHGFTLLEILVVILVIGILSGIASLAFYRDFDDELETEARRLLALLVLAEQEAVIRSQELAVNFENDGYKFLKFENKNWVTLNDEILRPRKLSGDMYIDVTLEGTKVDFLDEEESNPRVYILSSGEITPFEIIFRHDQANGKYIVRGDIDGQLESDN